MISLLIVSSLTSLTALDNFSSRQRAPYLATAAAMGIVTEQASKTEESKETEGINDRNLLFIFSSSLMASNEYLFLIGFLLNQDFEALAQCMPLSPAPELLQTVDATVPSNACPRHFSFKQLYGTLSLSSFDMSYRSASSYLVAQTICCRKRRISNEGRWLPFSYAH